MREHKETHTHSRLIERERERGGYWARDYGKQTPLD
jgi:hypothetical protein